MHNSIIIYIYNINVNVTHKLRNIRQYNRLTTQFISTNNSLLIIGEKERNNLEEDVRNFKEFKDF